MRRRDLPRVVCAAAAVALTAAGCSTPTLAPSPTPPSASTSAPASPTGGPLWPTPSSTHSDTETALRGVTMDPDMARLILGVLPVEEPASMDGYSPGLFGPGTDILEGDWPESVAACSIPSATLIRDALDVTVSPDCAILGGQWRDPFTGEDVATVDAVDAVFTIPPEQVWRSGGSKWTADQRRIYGSRQATFMAAQPTSVASRGGASITEWAPQQERAACLYALRWIAVKNQFGLTVTQDEKDYLEATVNTCPADMPRTA